MLAGKSYHHYLDDELSRDRVECYKLLARYNNAAEQPDLKGNSKDDRALAMRQVMRRRSKSQEYGPKGSIGDYTVIEAPFMCDYGYHLHIGWYTLIEKGCHFQDAGGIYIGDRVTIGPRVLITTMCPDDDPRAARGSQGTFKAGMVKIADDVFIGAGAVILPYVTIEKHAKVGAGSVVTAVSQIASLFNDTTADLRIQDVKAGWTVAGNPARRISEDPPAEIKYHKKKMIRQMEEMAAKQKWEEEPK